MPGEWCINPPFAECEGAARRWGVPRLVAQLLLSRGLNAEAAADAFIAPQLKDLHPPEQLHSATFAAELIHEAIRDGRRIVIYGDYDVDGTCGLAILWHTLRLAGADPAFYVPHRIEEGYGLNMEAAMRLAGEGAQMIVSVDCGITAVDVVERIRRAGVRVIITDHHAPQETLPPADAVVHPALGDGNCNKDLCGAGVAFKLAWAVAQRAGGERRVPPKFRELLMEMLPLAALGTIADVVSLCGENRIIAAHGLQRISRSSLPGLRALVASAGIKEDRVSGYDVGFKLAPRLNAAGRMGHARLAVELLTRADRKRADEIALYLEEHNRSRKAAERRIFKEACERIERENLASDARRGLVLASAEWHAGVVGIVAARLAERYRRPTVLIALSDGEGQGSARSVRHFDLARALRSCSGRLLSCGGHAMAAGLRIRAADVESFTEAFVATANNHLTGTDLAPRLRLDGEAALSELTLSTAELISALGPFGVGNPHPRLATDWVELAAEPRCVGQRLDHLQACFSQNATRIRGIGFGLGGLIEDLKHHRRCRVAFEPMINEFNGRRSVELQILDLKFPE